MEEVGWKEGDPIYGLPELPAVNPLNDYLTDGMCDIYCDFFSPLDDLANESLLQVYIPPAWLTSCFLQLC